MNGGRPHVRMHPISIRWNDQSNNYPRTRCTDPLDIRLVASLLPLSAPTPERQVPPPAAATEVPIFPPRSNPEIGQSAKANPPGTALSHLPRGPWRTIYRDSQGDAGVLPGLWRGALQGTRGHLGREKAGGRVQWSNYFRGMTDMTPTTSPPQ